MTHAEIKKGDAAMAECAKRGGDVTACQKNVVAALQSLDIARDKERQEAKRIAEFAEYQIHWGCNGDTSCIAEYTATQQKAEHLLNMVWELDRSGQITFDGYHPSAKIDALLALESGKNKAIENYSRLSAYLSDKGVSGALGDMGSSIVNLLPSAAQTAQDYFTAPIPAHQLERALDNLTLLTAQDAGALAFDTASGMMLGYAGGKVIGWTAANGWQALSGTAAEMAENYLKKQGLMPAIVPDGPKIPSSTKPSPVDVAHTIGADYNPRTGKVTGGHTLLNNDVKVLEVISQPDANGVYIAKVEMKAPDGTWIEKTSNNGQNAMFPKNWDAARVQAEIDSAWSMRVPHPDGTQSKWIGKSTSGVTIEGFERPRATAYPVYTGGKK